MKNTQSAFFYLLAISCFLQSRDRKRNFYLYWLTIFFFVAAITSKPSTVMLPLALALCLWWREGEIKQRDLRLLLPFVLISLLASGWTIWEQKFHSHATGADWCRRLFSVFLFQPMQSGSIYSSSSGHIRSFSSTRAGTLIHRDGLRGSR